MNAEAIFAEALAKTTSAERAAYLDRACEQDAVLRDRVETLLRSHEAAGSFLVRPVVELAAEQLAGQTTGETTLPAGDFEDEALAFLAPSDKPDSLGRLGHYEILEVIGRGGMGIVLRAFDEKLHRVVAIKVMSPELAATSPPRKRFLREARSAAQVRHEHVVDIHAVEEQPIPYLLMEYVSGETLQQKLDRVGPLEASEIRRIGQQIARGLAAAHERGLIHRDIKPSNILLEKGIEERVKITDFGLARAVADASLTQSGVIVGTPMYMAPEQTVGDTIDHRADLFSLGSVLYTMCSGRPPFRATTSMATLKRVAEDNPRPIREIIPEVPHWLCDIVTKLHSKKPEERFQSAREVADLLGKNLAKLEQAQPESVRQAASLPEKPGSADVRQSQVANTGQASSLPYGKNRRFAMAAAILLVVVGGLSLTEATGVTNLRTSVIRIFTPDGTLVVETDDSGVKVTIEGDGGLVITGTGLEEIRLRPGSYRVVADKDGKRLPLERELISIAKGGHEVVRVKLQAPPQQLANAGKGEFVLLSGDGAPPRKFDTLAAAVAHANDGDTIEIRGNGPFVTNPVRIATAALTIRAGAGFRPVIRLSDEGAQTYEPLLETSQRLVVEGLEFQRLGQKAWDGGGIAPLILGSRADRLYLLNCRFRWDTKNYHISVASGPGVSVIRNCEVLDPSDSAYAVGVMTLPNEGLRTVLENCVVVGDVVKGMWYGGSNKFGEELRLARNTLITNRPPICLELTGSPAESVTKGAAPPLRVEATGNMFDCWSVLWFKETALYREKHPALTEAEVEALVPRLLVWRERDNCFAPLGNRTWCWKDKPAPGANISLPAPNRLSGDGAKALEGRVLYKGGDLRARIDTELDKLAPDAFRLRPDSAGYQAGKDKKDLGADVDLVGPGAAYERWKKTPEYQQWLKDSGQIRTVAPKSETGAFVVIGGPDLVEKKFDTLAEAVRGASNGDTIEIRGNGPFYTDPIRLNDQPLTLRAGQGFRPLLKLNDKIAADRAALLTTNANVVLEGLEFLLPAPKPADNIFLSVDAPLYVANCRFLADTLSYQHCLLARSHDVRNCEFLNAAVLPVHPAGVPGRRHTIQNCLHAGHHVLGLDQHGSDYDVDVRLLDNTFISTDGAAPIFFSHGPAPAKGAQAKKAIRVEASGNIFDASVVLHIHPGSELPAGEIVPPKEAEMRTQAILGWEDRGNLYNVPRLISWHGVDAEHGPKSLADWKKFWGNPNADVREGQVRYKGGDRASKLSTARAKLTPDDFRLRPDSAGSKAGKDKKDLGADVDLVGPGAAYERWKKTPEYQQWLKNPGQSK